MRFNEFKVNEALPALAKVAKALSPMKKPATGGATGDIANKVGAVATAKPQAGAGASMANKVVQKTQQELQKKMIQKGSKVPFPTQSGQAKEFEIDDVKGDEVTLVNPDARNKPEEPEKMTYKKKDVETVVNQIASQQSSNY